MTQNEAIAKLIIDCKTREDIEKLIKEIFEQFKTRPLFGMGRDFKENFFQDDKFYEIVVNAVKG